MGLELMHTDLTQGFSLITGACHDSLPSLGVQEPLPSLPPHPAWRAEQGVSTFPRPPNEHRVQPRALPTSTVEEKVLFNRQNNQGVSKELEK